MKALDSGVRVEIQEAGDGAPVQAGGVVVFHYDTFLPDGTLVDSSRGREQPFAAHLAEDDLLLAGLRQGLEVLHAGARARIHVPAEQAYGAVGKGDIPADSPLEFQVEVLDVPRRTQAGTYIHLRQDGEGAPVADGDHVVVQFRGWTLPSGREFWSSQEEGQPLEFQVGAGQVLAGLEDAVRGLRPGARALCLIPPALAYGDEGKLPDVPPGKEVWFELELMGVRNNR